MIRWEMSAKDDKLPLKFSGVPYIWLGKQDYHCHQGRDKHKTGKASYIEKQKREILNEHSHVKTRKSTQPSKKMDCPVKFSTKKIFTFPYFKIEKDTKRKRTEASQKLKEYLSSFTSMTNVKCENKESVKLEVKDMSQLQYLVKLPTDSIHKYHHTGRAAGLSEKLDDRISGYLRTLIENGHRRVKDLQSRAKEYAMEKIFFGENCPSDVIRKRFYPNAQKIRNLITSVRLLKRFSKIDQENLQHLKETWSTWADVHFTARYCT